MDISIIIPVYNSASFLYRCMDSIFSQKFDGFFEIIAIDDASTDESLDILNEYQKDHIQLKVLSLTTNVPVSAVRTIGLQTAQGRYILQVDSDDWIMPDMLQILWKEAGRTNADVIAFNYFRENSRGERLYERNITKTLYTSDISKVIDNFKGACWNKMVKRELIKGLYLYELTSNYGEDMIFSVEILLRAKNFLLLDYYFYAYFDNTSSLTHNRGYKKGAEAILKINKTLTDLLLKYNAPYVSRYMYKLQLKYYIEYCIRYYFQKVPGIDLDALISSFMDMPSTGKTKMDLRRIYLDPSYLFFQFLRGRLNIRLFLKYIKRQIKGRYIKN